MPPEVAFRYGGVIADCRVRQERKIPAADGKTTVARAGTMGFGVISSEMQKFT